MNAAHAFMMRATTLHRMTARRFAAGLGVAAIFAAGLDVAEFSEFVRIPLAFTP